MRPSYFWVLILVVGCGDPDARGGLETPSSVETTEATQPSEPLVRDPSLGTRTSGIDWPDFLGPGRRNKSPETGILKQWPAEGPRVVWKKRRGIGYAACSISEGRLMQFDRRGSMARLTCMNSETGEELWHFEYRTAYRDLLGYNNGPRCAPVIDGDRVYIYGAEGKLHCVRVADGKLVWMVDMVEEYNVVQNFFGAGSTPLVEGDLVIAQVGGSSPDSPPIMSGRVRGNGSGIVAWDKMTGKERYRITDELAAYASPVAATIAGRRWCFSFSRGGLVAFEPQTGKVDFHFPWRSAVLESVNASTPIVIDDRVFISETYGPGACMLRVEEGSYEVLWSDKNRRRNKSMQTHWNTPIYHEGTIYGSSGRHAQGAELRAIDARDGRVLWSQPRLARSSLLYVDGHFVCLSEDGTLRLIKVNPARYEEVAAVVLKDHGQRLLRYPAWPAPVLSHGLLYIQDERQLVCLDLRGEDMPR